MNDVAEPAGYCWVPECMDPNEEDAARLNVEPKPAVFLTQEDLVRHVAEKHHMEVEFHIPPDA